jgi:protocatechuate 3,4-dioxygenase beta subunit
MRTEDVSGPRRLEGRLVDEEGKAVAGAQVFLLPGDRTAVTGADGTFAFERLASRRYWVSAVKDDFYAGPTVVRLASNGEVRLRLQQGVTLVVHVTADRKPVAGASVVLDEVFTATTDVDGAATVRGLGPGFLHGWIRVPGWTPELLSVSVHQDPGGFVERFVTLRRGASVEGVVLGLDAAPVPGITVQLVDASDGRCFQTARAGSDGRWRFDAVPARTFRVFARPSDPQQIECDGVTPTPDVVLRIDVGGHVSGIVVDEDGASVANASVSLRGELGYHVFSDPDGRFSLSRVLVGPYEVDACTWTKASPAMRVQAGAKPVEARLVVEGAQIAGTVIDEHGKAVGEAHVYSKAISSHPYMAPKEAVTDALGRFDFGALEPGEYDVHTTWSDERRRREDAAVQRVQTGQTNVELVLAPGATIMGRVLIDGHPLPYFGIAIMEPKYAPVGGSPIGIRTVDGHFTLRHQAAGTWRVVLLGPGTRAKVLDNIVIEPGRTADLGDIEMERGRRIAGHVRDRSGAPVSGARVVIARGSREDQSRLEQWFSEHYEARTDLSGAYRFEGIDIDRAGFRHPLISAKHPVFGESLLQDVPPGDATLDFELLGAGGVEGSVEGARGHQLFACAVREGEPDHARMTPVDRSGRFGFDDLPPGQYTIDLKVEHGKQLTPATVTVVTGETARMKIVVESLAVNLTVKIPWGNANDVKLEPTGDNPPARPRFMGTALMGDSVSFSYLAPGRYRVSGDGENWTEVDVAESPPDQTIELPRP